MIELILSATTILGTLLLALIAYLNNRKNATNILFAILASSFSGVAFSTYLATHTTDQSIALFWVRATMFFASIVVSSLFLFIHTYPEDKVLLKKPFFLTSIIWTVILASLCLTPLVFKKVLFDPNLNPVPGPGIALFALSLVVNMGLGIYFLVKKYRHSTGYVKAQIQFLGVGLFTSFTVLTILNFLVVILLKNTSSTNIGISSILIFIGSTFYAIVRHKLLNIRLIVARAVAYTLLITGIGVFYTVATIFSTSLFLKTSTNLPQLLLFTLLTILVALTFQTLRRVVEQITDKIFFKNPYEPEVLLADLTHIMATTLLLDQLSQLLLQKVTKEMKISRGAFVLINKEKIFAIESLGFNPELKLTNQELFTLQSANQTLVMDNLPDGPTKQLLSNLKISLSLPLKTGKEGIGVLLLGEKESGEIYSDQDLNVLNIFAPEVSVAIQNAKSYEEIRRFNITLKEEVERATAELKVANDKLRELDKLKDEFISVTSHDLRTPLTAIKSYLWLALHGKAGKLNEKMNFYLDRSYQSSERMLALISDLLDVSRIERGKIELHLEPADLGKVLDMVLDELNSKAIEKNISLVLKLPTRSLPEVMLDQERFPEIVTNLVGNSLKFTPVKGKVTVGATISKNMVEVSVTDTGVGIGKEDLPKLFAKFGRLDTSYKAIATTGGTGLGLYITKSLVQLHGGKIGVSSQLGKGTTFTFSLRVATEIEKKQKKYIPAPEGVIINPELMGAFKTNTKL